LRRFGAKANRDLACSQFDFGRERTCQPGIGGKLAPVDFQRLQSRKLDEGWTCQIVRERTWRIDRRSRSEAPGAERHTLGRTLPGNAVADDIDAQRIAAHAQVFAFHTNTLGSKL